MANGSPPSARATYSCMRCADRKVKCDRQRPCSACVKHNVECIFNPLRPPGKKRKHVKDQILLDRLKHYESLLQNQGIDPRRLPESSEHASPRTSGHIGDAITKEEQVLTPSSISSEPNHVVNKTQVVHRQGRSKFLDNSLWTRVVEEFNEPEDALEDSSNDTSDPELSDDDFGFVLNSRSKSDITSRHPPPEGIHTLWQIFMENIDPMTKVVHVPTLRPAIQKAANDIENIPRTFEALMFAMYSMAVLSLDDPECQQRLGEPRKTLLSRYIHSTKVALLKANFMGTINLVVLQALVLHVLSVRDTYEPRAVYTLTGVAVRIAQGMGLERDGEVLGLPPFETEIRRRIWLVLRTHDNRTAELCGLAKLRDLDTGAQSTKWPTNINDEQLHPNMLSIFEESNNVTDAVYIVIMGELNKFAATRVSRFREQGKSSSQWDLHATGTEKLEIDEAHRELEEILQMKYLRYCDPSQPLHLMTMMLARISLNIIFFLRHHPRRWANIEETPLSERQAVWEVCIKLLEQHNMMQSNPLLKQFSWNAAYFLQWRPFIHLLDTLRATPLLPDSAKVWQLIGKTYDNNPKMILDTRKPIHVAVGNLCLKAYDAREAALKNTKTSPPSTPDFILKLRQQRDLARAKRQARNARISEQEKPATLDQTSVYNTNPKEDAKGASSSGALLSMQSPSTTSSRVTEAGTIASDPFWFVNGFGDGQAGNFNDAMNIDPDIIMNQHYNLEDNGIAWDQWDAWLANSNLIRPV